MELEVEQKILNKALSIVSKVAGGGGINMLPILNNVLMRAKDGVLSLMTTNLNMAVVVKIRPMRVTDGEITVPARLITDFVSNLPREEKIGLKVDGNKVVMKAGKYSSALNGVAAEEFPELPEIDEAGAVIFRAGVDDFKEAVGEVVVACSTNTARPIFTGVFFNTFEGVLYMAATDGYRLAERKFIDKVESEVKAIVPASSLQEVMRSIDDSVNEVEILLDETQVRFRLGEVEITSKLIDGVFVDYRHLIPKTTTITTVVERAEMARVVKLAALFAQASGGTINCEAKQEKGVLSVAAVANEFGENDSEVEAEVDGDGKVALNSKYLLDALNAIKEEKLVFGFSEKATPILIKNQNRTDYIHVVMPQI